MPIIIEIDCPNCEEGKISFMSPKCDKCGHIEKYIDILALKIMAMEGISAKEEPKIEEPAPAEIEMPTPTEEKIEEAPVEEEAPKEEAAPEEAPPEEEKPTEEEAPAEPELSPEEIEIENIKKALAEAEAKLATKEE